MDPVVRFERVGKRYRIGTGIGSLRDSVDALAARAVKRRRHTAHDLWALDDVTFDVGRGEAIGLIGDNGAGKTTALKLMARVTIPTRGRVLVPSSVAALIELGAGFHPDMTGRENVFLNGLILGLSKSAIAARYDAIVEFAELDRFMDTPVKRYSSGMYARLGFSVAAHVCPELLLVDEVLSVGDVDFQLKCLRFLHRHVADGHTTVFVSHNLYALEQLCSRLVWLDHGHVAASGPTPSVLHQYMDHLEQRRITGVTLPDSSVAGPERGLRIRACRLTDEAGTPREILKSGDTVVVQIEYSTTTRIERPFFCVWISEAGSQLPITAANMLLDGHNVAAIEGEGAIECVFHALPLMPRAYSVWLEVYGADRAEVLYRWSALASFRVVADRHEEAPIERGQLRFSRAHGPLKADYEWRRLPSAPGRSAAEGLAGSPAGQVD